MSSRAKVIKTEIRDGHLWLTSPYRPELPPRLKAIGGKWDAEVKKWYFPISSKTWVMNLCQEFWGVTPELNEEVGVEHSSPSQAIDIATRLAPLMPDLNDEQRELIYEMLFNQG